MTAAALPRCRKGPSSRPDACRSSGTGSARRPPSPSRTFFPGATRAVAALLLALPCAPALAADGPEATREIAWPEGSVARVLSLPADTPSDDWRLSGPDAARFRVEAGALRFAAPPDFERAGDADADNRYAVTLRRAGADGDAIAVTVRVQDRDEPGRAVLQPSRPAVGEPVTVSLSDPDRADDAPAPAVQWERWRGPGEWQAIPQATGPRYTPTAADAGRPLRAVVSYTDRHGPDRQAVAELPDPVVGPMLSALAARTDSARSRPASEASAPRPAFDPRILHYGVRCGERDVMTVSFSAPPGVRVSVNGIQPRPGREGSAAVTVTPTSDVAVTVSAADGAWTTYTLHCMPPELWAIRTGPDPARPLETLLALTGGPWAAVIDEHGVSRAHVRAGGGTAGFFLRPFGSGPDLRWAHFEQRPEEERKAPDERLRRWRVLDRNLEPLQTIATGAPLTTTGQHDFRLLADGSALLMTHEPSVRDLSGLAFPDREGKPWGAAVKMEDSAIQLRGPDGAVRWTWSSWSRLPLEDCAQHWFPGNWAHVNSVQWTDEGVLASFRGCSTVVMIDPAAPPGEEIVWRLGASNLSRDDWQRRGLGPPPLRIVGDPEGAFCGQHAAQLLPPPPGLRLSRLLLFDNGVACVIDPRTGNPLGRPSGVYSRAVEYALDLEHGEAVFVRDHALGGTRDMLGHAGGHVEPLPDGGWLVSWGGLGRASPDRVGGKRSSDMATRVDPATGMESFRIPAAESDGAHLRALPVSPLALMQAPGRLVAVLPDVPPAGHGGAGETVEVAVAFSRPVAAFGPETGSVAVAGGALAEAAPLDGFGRPAHAWRLVLAPSGDGPLELRFRAGVACTGPAPGICTADGERLLGIPDAVPIPRNIDEDAARDRAADAGHATRSRQN